MTNWPDKPLIRVLDGEVNEGGVADALAYHVGDGTYALISEEHMDQTIVRDACGDMIVKWEELTPVPTAALKRLQQALRGVDKNTYLAEITQEVFSYLPANKPSPLDQAVTRVKDAGSRMIDAETLPEERLSLLLDALASVQSAARKTAPLTMVARICADWANVEGARGDSLEVVRRRVEALSDTGSFIILSALVGDVTTTMREDFSPRHDLIDAGAYALAWVAQIIEEEDK